MTTRKELVGTLRVRYQGAVVGVGDKAKILDEFVALTGYHRKHATRILLVRSIRSLNRARTQPKT
jgi:hypothetical protein